MRPLLSSQLPAPSSQFPVLVLVLVLAAALPAPAAAQGERPIEDGRGAAGAPGEGDAAPSEQGRLKSTLVAEVNGEAILRQDLEEVLLLDRTWQELRRRGGAAAERELRAREREVLDDLVAERIFLKAAAEKKLALSPDEVREVDRAFDDRAVAEHGSVAALEELLEERGISRENVRRRFRNHRLIESLALDAIGRDHYVRPAEIQAYYDVHKDEWAEQGKVEVRLIRMARRRSGGGGAEAEAAGPIRAELELLRADIVAGKADFAEVARARSDGPRAEDGGLLTLGSRKDIPAVAAALEKLEPGGISEVVAARDAFYLVKLEREVLGGPKPLEAVQDEIHRLLLDEKKAIRYKRWTEELRAKAYVRIYLDEP